MFLILISFGAICFWLGCEYNGPKVRNSALREAIDLAFDIEVKYAPKGLDDDSDCCECKESHAKADGAAEVVDAIQRRLS